MKQPLYTLKVILKLLLNFSIIRLMCTPYLPVTNCQQNIVNKIFMNELFVNLYRPLFSYLRNLL